jgi:hypothetical protein
VVLHRKLSWRARQVRKWVYRSEIIRALDELIADEAGMRFQGIAVVHGKIKRDARETNKHHPDVKVLIFSTAGRVSEHQKEPWAEEILKTFGLHLIVVSREEFITWLRDPAQSDICRDQLGIAVSMPSELEPALKCAQEAAKALRLRDAAVFCNSAAISSWGVVSKCSAIVP